MEKTMGATKHIALIAHDNMKESLIEWCDEHKELLARHFLCGTGTTARMVARFRPDCTIIAPTPDEHTYNQLGLCRGVVPAHMTMCACAQRSTRQLSR